MNNKNKMIRQSDGYFHIPMTENQRKDYKTFIENIHQWCIDMSEVNNHIHYRAYPSTRASSAWEDVENFYYIARIFYNKYIAAEKDVIEDYGIYERGFYDKGA